MKFQRLLSLPVSKQFLFRSIALLVMAAAGAGCTAKDSSSDSDKTSSGSPARQAPVCTVDRFKQPSNPVSNKVDVLFVMDNSQSMHRHWELMAKSIGKLIHAMPAGQDLRFSVVLGTITKFKGVLFSAPGVPKVLSIKSMTEAQIMAALQKTFAHAMIYDNVDWKGAGEALFYSLYDAVTAKAAANQKLGFFRADAALSVIFMSDDAEESFPYPARQVWGLPSKCNWAHHEVMRKTFYLPAGIDADSTFSALQRLKGNMPVLTSAFVNITKADILVDNSMNARCIYDSPGFGYFEIVKRTNGLLYSIHQNRERGLELAGKLLRSRIELLHDFKLSKPATLVDPGTIEAKVDGKTESHSYSADTNVVHIDQSGGPGSAVEISHCEPVPQHEWTLSGFTGETTQTSATLHWNTAEYPTSGKVVYGTSPDTLNEVAAESGSGTSHTITVGSLLPGTTYYFQAVAEDDLGGVKRSDVITLHTRPDWILSPLVGQASRTSVSLSWNTVDYPTTGKVLWGTSPDSLSNSTPVTTAEKSHTVSLEGLSPSTTYFFQAVSQDEFGLERASPVLSLSTTADWAIVGFTGQVSRTSASFEWHTPEEATSGLLRYGTSPDQLGLVASDSAEGNDHAVRLANLQPGTTYFFQSVAKSLSDGREKLSTAISLKTLNDWVLAGLSTNATENTIAVSFTTTGYPTDAKVLWGTSAGSLVNSENAGAASEAHETSLAGLQPNTVYFLQAVAKDDLGVERRSDVISVRTKVVIDPPPVWTISGFDGSATTDTATLVWHTSDYPTTGKVLWGTSPDVLSNVVSEDVTGKDHSVAVTGLQPDSVYFFQAVVRDDKGQEQQSAVIAVRTQSVPLPSWNISNFAGTGDVHSVTLSFSTADYPTIGKIVWGTSNGNLVNETPAETSASTSHTFTVTGLAANSTFFFQAVSTDDHAQVKQSQVIAVKTTTAPPTWSIVSFDGTTTSTAANLIWQTPGTPTKAVVKVGLSATDLSFRSVDVPDFAASHLVSVTGLTPSTKYFFQVVATDADGGSVSSTVITKTTKAR